MTKSAPDMPTKILQAAIQLFAQRGVTSTSIQAVADAVGIRKQSLLYHFPNKNVLRQAVLHDILSYWKNVVPRALVQATSGEHRLESALKVVIDFFLEDRYRAQFVVREVLDRPREMSNLIKNHFHPWMGLVTNYIRTGQERGEVYDDVDPEAYVVQCIILSICVISAGDVLQGVFPEGDALKNIRSRMIAEVQRMTKYGLFVKAHDT
ncbi:TetR/AcrR family transcriptional regulator [candidate division CSSED10-310 bacterium]|uniref:TetR/AcrR family transcriptional regulator n=1 Tax=candidate division CSSED10-310 bacterium TaxID=2855610 RepID=A0ABV6YYY5_UNCC1